MTNKKNGFTLIEMLIVVVVIGVLAAIVFPKISSGARESKISVCRANILTINGTIELIGYKEAISIESIDGVFPTTNFTAIGPLTIPLMQQYFPDGGVVCPVLNSAYTIVDGRVDRTGHDH